jgi:hypothetical protein
MSKFIAKSNGKFITITFIKKNGAVRKLNGRIGVTKYLKGGVSTINPDLYMVVYDTAAKGYRCISKDAIVSVTCEGLTVTNNALAAQV